MDHRSLSNLVLRLAGVIILVNSALAIPRTAVSLFTANAPGGGMASFIAMSALSALLPVLLGLALVWFPGTVTNRLVGPAADGKLPTGIDYLKLRQLAFCVLGLYFTSNALFDAVYWFARHKLYQAMIAADPNLMMAPVVMPDDFAGMVSTGMQLVVGLVLVLGSKGVNNIVAKLQA